MDYAGIRTLDSVIRAREIFRQNEIAIISQEFHNERAIGFNAKDVSGKNGIKTKLREYLARTKVFLDIIFHIKPKYLGDKKEIG